MQRFQIVLAYDRPSTRIALYQLSGIAEAAEKFAKNWQRILDGPRIYEVSPEAIRAFEDWFQRAWAIAPDLESYIRRYAFAAIKYSLILRAVVKPDGVIDEAAMRSALRIADRHLSDLYRALSEFTVVSNWHQVYKKIVSYLNEHPTATRSNLLQGVRNIGGSKFLNEYLETIADAFAAQPLGEIATKLRQSSRRY